MKKQSVIGIFAHVDAGKTTLSEALLYKNGDLRALGRVDHGNSFLDNDLMEREHGITVFLKQAILEFDELVITLVDTPGHSDFSPEMVRSLDVLDAAILVLSASEPVQAQTLFIWKLLIEKKIPIFVFINKMDLVSEPESHFIAELNSKLGNGFFNALEPDVEFLAGCDEVLFDTFFEKGSLTESSVKAAFRRAAIFPCWFGSALHLTGIDTFLNGLKIMAPEYKGSNAFSAIVYKISRDERGGRLTHMKISGGTLSVKDVIPVNGKSEKINQIRLYSGQKYQTIDSAFAGQLVSVIGPAETFAGQRINMASGNEDRHPVLYTYEVIANNNENIFQLLEALRSLEEEFPELSVEIQNDKRIIINLTGKLQQELISRVVYDHFSYSIELVPTEIKYKETILEQVRGAAHYEDGSQMAEIVLELRPNADSDEIIINWNSLPDEYFYWKSIFESAIHSASIPGVLSGNSICALEISFVSVRLRLHHSTGIEIIECVHRAIRQALLKSSSIMLEPWTEFDLSVPDIYQGRLISEFNRQNLNIQFESNDGLSFFSGRAPLSFLRSFSDDLTVLSHGLSSLSAKMIGYQPCINQEGAAAGFDYDAFSDDYATGDSIYYKNGGKVVVPWNKIEEYMESLRSSVVNRFGGSGEYKKIVSLDNELLKIFESTYGKIKPKQIQQPEKVVTHKPYVGGKMPQGPELILIDGYNVIFSWDELHQLAKISLDMARASLINILQNYCAFMSCELILVFDAYKVPGNKGLQEKNNNFTLVFTGENETADSYIEKKTAELKKSKDYSRIRVVSSDNLEQLISHGHGALRVPSDYFYTEVQEAIKSIDAYLKKDY